jgi:DNA-binding transcriptional MerR regulator
METKCPHCGKSIELVGAGELDKEYGLNGNKLQYLRDSGKFPEPWLSFGNRKIYLRADVDAFEAQRAQEGAGKVLTEVQKYLETLPPEERERVIKALQEGA